MDKRLKKGSSIPSSLGDVVDEYRRVRDIRLAMKKETDAVEERERELKDHLINEIPKSEITGVAGKRFRAQIVKKDVPAAEDWKQIHAWVMQNERFDILQKRLADKAIKDMWEEGETIPGVVKFPKVDVSVTKI